MNLSGLVGIGASSIYQKARHEYEMICLFDNGRSTMASSFELSDYSIMLGMPA